MFVQQVFSSNVSSSVQELARPEQLFTAHLLWELICDGNPLEWRW